MKIDYRFLYVPKYFDMIVSSTGQLSGEIRFRRIIEIGKKNIWLAARCKNTCIKEEPDVINWIILRCSVLYYKFNDLQSLIALFELKEYGVLGYLLGLVNSKGELYRTIQSLIDDNNISFSNAFTKIVELIDINLGLKLFSRSIELGYVFDIHAYNRLLAMVKTPKDVQELTSLMFSSGVDANATTFFNLIKKDTTYEAALYHFSQLKSIVDLKTDIELIRGAYALMFRKCLNITDVFYLFEDCEATFPDIHSQIRNNDMFYKTLCILYNDGKNNNRYSDSFKNLIFEQIQELKFKKELFTRSGANDYKRKKQSSALSIAIMRELTTMSSSFDLILKFFQDTLYLIVTQLESNVAFYEYSDYISKIMEKANSFTKGKQLIEIMLNNNQRVSSSCIGQLLKYAKNKEEIDFVLKNSDFLKIKPKSLVSILNGADENVSLYLYEHLKKHDYPMNIFIYNALIKCSTIQHSLYLIGQMQKDEITPDIMTIQPLLRRWNSLKDLEEIVLLAINLKIEADEKSVYAIKRHSTELNIESDLIDYSYEKVNMHSTIHGTSWEKAIIKASNALIG